MLETAIVILIVAMAVLVVAVRLRRTLGRHTSVAVCLDESSGPPSPGCAGCGAAGNGCQLTHVLGGALPKGGAPK